jgi:transposase-like protein
MIGYSPEELRCPHCRALNIVDYKGIPEIGLELECMGCGKPFRYSDGRSRRIMEKDSNFMIN